MRIGIDLLGGDRPPEQLFDAIIQAVNDCDPNVSFLVFADEETRNKTSSLIHSKRIEFTIAPEVIEMQDEPIQAVRGKKNSSLILGLRALKRKKIAALISIGNTGALLAGATLILPKLPDVRRPALLALFPVENKKIALIDVGGNLQCKAQHFLRFAEMGAAYKRVSENLVCPRIGLLNIGGESKKGTAEHRQAYQMLMEASSASSMEFVGNVEAGDIFQGTVDVLVTDGFSGNVLLKTAEGMALFMLSHLQRAFPSGFPASLEAVQKQFSYTEHPGAILLGVDGVIVKCHGNSSAQSVLNGIKSAVRCVKEKLIEKLKAGN